MRCWQDGPKNHVLSPPPAKGERDAPPTNALRLNAPGHHGRQTIRSMVACGRISRCRGNEVADARICGSRAVLQVGLKTATKKIGRLSAAYSTLLDGQSSQAEARRRRPSAVGQEADPHEAHDHHCPGRRLRDGGADVDIVDHEICSRVCRP
jgi:hypothetical protein